MKLSAPEKEKLKTDNKYITLSCLYDANSDWKNNFKYINKAASKYEEIKEKYKEKKGREYVEAIESLIVSYNALGALEYKNKQFNDADKQYNKAEIVAKELKKIEPAGDKELEELIKRSNNYMAVVFNNKGLIYFNEKNIKCARKYLEKALQYQKEDRKSVV